MNISTFKAICQLVVFSLVLGVLLTLSCMLTAPKIKTLPDQALDAGLARKIAAYTDARHWNPETVTNKIEIPTPPGMLASPALEIVRVQSRVLALAMPPAPRIIINTNSIAFSVPANTDRHGATQLMLVRATQDLKTWRTVAQVPQVNSTNVIVNIRSTNAHEFYETVSVIDWLPPLADNRFIVGTTNRMR